jgi:hypothetical protein
MKNTSQSLIDQIFKQNPYENFDSSKYPLDLQTWTNNDIMFKKTILELKPSVIIEVGSWKGATAITWAKIIQKYKLKTKIICIDTFLGSSVHWSRLGEQYDDLKLKNGYPTLYYQFLANVVKSNCQDIIIPIPNTSMAGYLILENLGVSSEMIFIDAGHDFESVYLDTKYFLNLLVPGGRMFGHDYNLESIQMAVNKFRDRKDIKIIDYKSTLWIIEKISNKEVEYVIT